MYSISSLVALAEQSLMLALVLSLPVVASAAIASFLVSVLQALTQIQDSTLAHLPRLLAVAAALALSAPWLGARIVALGLRVLGG